MNPNGKTLRSSAALAVLALIAGCGGGGGGDSGPPPLTYTGNQNAATISPTNAGALSSSAASGGSDLPVSSVASSGNTAGSGGFIGDGQRVARSVRAMLLGPKGGSPLTSRAVDQTEPCENGGTIRVAGDINDMTGL